MSLRIAIVTDDPGWHGARLRAAFAARGCAVRLVSLRECRLETGPGAPGVWLPGFGGRLPDGVFVRGVPGGSLEEVVFYLDILHCLRELGVPVVNDARAIERTVDKGMTSLLLHRAGIATPPAAVVTGAGEARRRVLEARARGGELVCKPLFGSQGEGVVRVTEPDQLPSAAACRGVWYLQRFVPVAGRCHDWRVFVIGGRAVAAMRREGEGWVSNVARGGRCEAALLDDTLRSLAEGAVAALEMDYAGVDIIRGADGRAWVLEVNSVPAWKGLQSVCSLDIAAALADHCLRRCAGVPAALEALP